MSIYVGVSSQRCVLSKKSSIAPFGIRSSIRSSSSSHLRVTAVAAAVVFVVVVVVVVVKC